MDEKLRPVGESDASETPAETTLTAHRSRHGDASGPSPSAATDSAAAKARTADASEPAETVEATEVESPEPEGTSGGIVSTLQNVAGPVAGAIGSVIGAASQAWSGSDGAIGRRLRRQAREPLANLFEVFPEARNASPHELGMRFVPVEEIRGTAVAGATQRGGDFLPLKPFRGENWQGRWQRIREANERLHPLPPVDLIKYDGEYWVVDGHNRVAVTLYSNGVGLDAMVTELVPLDGQTSERPRNLLAYLGEAGELRAAAQGRMPAMGMRLVELRSAAEAAVLSEDERLASQAADLERSERAARDATGVSEPPEAD
jgi:hypothetical protein